MKNQTGSMGVISVASARGRFREEVRPARSPVGDLSFFAKLLFVAAIAWQRCDLRRRCGSKKLSAEATNSRKKKGPGAGGRARPGPKFAERIEHRPLFALHVGEMLEEERAIFSFPHHRADTA
jgi:hypothetical protein